VEESAMRARVLLVDRNPEIVEAWKYQFTDVVPPAEIRCADVLDPSAFGAQNGALVVPGNAFGFLDRGLELAVCDRWGFALQDRLREVVRERFRGELLVGQAAVLTLPPPPAGGTPPPYRLLIYVAATRTPRALEGSLAAYLAARGAFLAVEAEDAAGRAVEKVVVPGIGTGSSGVHPMVSARQVRYAYEVFRGLRGYGDKNLSQLARREAKLRSLPRSLTEDPEDGPNA
jgi:O-acetyl-ADP-ribose deacetylase (regulator of RNase III)